MAFGLKYLKFETKTAYTNEEMFEAIKDKEFTGGAPMMVKHGLVDIIVWPQIDRNNQVWLQPAQLSKGPYTKWQVYKNQPAGLDNAITKGIVDHFTGGLTALSGTFGKNAKSAEEMVQKTCDELKALDL